MQAQLVDFGDSINESNLTNRLSNIDPFDSNNPSVVNQYKVFFDTMGTHVVVGATYGASLQMVSMAICFAVVSADTMTT